MITEQNLVAQSIPSTGSLPKRHSGFMRNPLITRKLRADLTRNRASFFMVWSIFTLGIIFSSATYPAGKSFGDSVTRVFERTHLADLWFDMASAPVSVVDSVRALNGVSAANGRISEDMGITWNGSASMVTLRTISMPTSDADLNNIVLIQGRLPAANDEIVLLESFALAQKLQIGDTVRLSGGANASGTTDTALSVHVVGLVSSGEYLIAARGQLQPFPSPSTFGVGYLPYDTLAAHFNLGGQVNNIDLALAPAADLNTVRAAAVALLQPYTLQQALDRHQFAPYATLNANVSSNTQVGLVFSIIFLLGSGSVMLVLLARQIEGERRTIGTLRAIGYSRREIVSYYLVFALLIVVTGAAVAVPIGFVLSTFMLNFFQRGMIGATVPFSSNVLNWAFISLGIAISATMALLGALLPAWRAATTDPGLALRPPSPTGLPWLARLPIPAPKAIRQGIRDLLRVPSRSVGTVIGTVCGLALIVLCFAVWDDIDYNFNGYYQSHHYDFTVTLKNPAATQGFMTSVNGIAGVTGLETGLIAPVQVQLSDRTYTAEGIVLADQERFITFNTIQGAPAFSNADGVWLGHNLARTLNAKAGDILTISAQGMTKQVKVEGIVLQVLGAPLYIPHSLFAQWFPLPIANQAYVQIDPAQHTLVQQRLNTIPGVIGVEDWLRTTEDTKRVVAFNGNNAVLFLAFGLILTFVVLFNSISSSLQERHTELAIMRMQGVSSDEITRMITWEVAITVLIGVLIGIVPTYALIDYTMQLYNTDVAGQLTIVYAASWAIGIGILALTALFSQWLSLRQVWRIKLGDISKAVGV